MTLSANGHRPRLLLTTGILLVLITGGVMPSFGQSDLEDLNCAVTPDQILGQSFSMTAGASGETGEAQLTPEGVDILNNDLDADVGWIVENLPYSDTGDNDVALLVVDDFSSEPYDPDEENLVSHGWLVWDVLEQLQAALPSDVADHIRLEQVNIAGDNGYRSDLIETAISDTIAALGDDGYERFVINMSFVFIPCVDSARGFNFDDFLAAREDNPSQSLIAELGADEAYIRGLLVDPSVAAIDESGFEIDEDAQPRRGGPPDFVAEQVAFLRFFEDRRLEGDPLGRFFTDLDVMAIPVASAGNFKWKRPFYPARWREVLSISASEGDDLGKWSHSNSGEVMVPGAWFSFEDGEYRAGTSFAAPVASLMIALDMTQDSPNCGIRGGGPQLGSAQFENTPLADAADGC